MREETPPNAGIRASFPIESAPLLGGGVAGGGVGEGARLSEVRRALLGLATAPVRRAGGQQGGAVGGAPRVPSLRRWGLGLELGLECKHTHLICMD